jgi:hypothetical protein
MDTLWFENIDWIIEHQVKPGEIAKIKDFNSNQVEILDVFYIEHIKKYKKLIHLSRPFVISGIEHFQFEWETRMSLAEIISYLGTSYFVQVNQHTIVRTISIQGHASDWSTIQIVGLNRFENETNKWLAKEIILGEKFKDQIRVVFSKLYRVVLKNFNKNAPVDILYINPLDIIYIDISQKERIIYLSKPFAVKKENCYIIHWKTRYKASEIIAYLDVDNFERVNRFQIINLNFLTSYTFEKDQKKLQLRLFDGTLKTISIGETYRNNLI